MIKARTKKALVSIVSASCMALLLASLVVPFTLALYVKGAESEGFFGEISLRSYFERGSGAEDDPYVITRPRHLYNLSRLQGLGLFGEKTYFELGLVGLNGDTSGQPRCYLDDSSSTVVPFLDMSESNYDYEPINAIGSEAMPFYGEFNGHGLEIKNLTVYADPQDAGLFGYTAHSSKIYNLFLSNVTINALGYTAGYANLYGPSSTAGEGASFTYNYDSDSDTFISSDVHKVKSADFDASDIFNWNEQSGDPQPAITAEAPLIGYASTNPNFKYKILTSGDFAKDNGDGTVSVDLETVYKFFKKEKSDPATTYPLNASSSISLVASTTDNYGLDHSKVVMTMMFDFSLASGETNYLTMNAHLGNDHPNNIGLLIGHCDGSINDCYVYNGGFAMNNGSSFSSATYYPMANGSNYGLIGLIGGTVHNIAAKESDASTNTGKDIGVLDFTTVYKEIIDNNSFVGYVSESGGVTYTPTASLKYRDFLRVNGSGHYITLAENTVSFNRQRIITNSDLGIFTVATDYTGTGMAEEAGVELGKSVVKSIDVSHNSSYYVYYSTGEYEKGKGVNFDDYRAAIKTDTPSHFYPGYHFPNYDQISSASFEERDRHQNYVFRFKVTGDYRTGKGFYFSDVDKDTDGGSFISKYFEHKLVDQNGHPIPASANSGKSGVMLRNSLGQEIRSFSANFATPDYSPNGSKMNCISNAEYSDPAANMVNFEIKTDVANVTIVSGLANPSKAAALGIYKIDGETRKTSGGIKYIDRTYNDPDYAFFMPTDEHLAYFDYNVDGSGVGQIGVYEYNDQSDEFEFEEADIHTNATIPNSYDVMNCPGGEYGFETGKKRLFAHTFKLPRGRYCVGSATGTSNNGEGIAEIYYLCAQGQTDGQISFDDNAFASQDEVKNIDFLKKECYTYNPSTGAFTTNITLGEASVYDPANSTLVENHRCYVALANSDRSYFDDSLCDIQFVYEDNKFKITSSTQDKILYLAVSNYASNHSLTGIPQTVVKVLDLDDSTDTKITYYSA